MQNNWGQPKQHVQNPCQICLSEKGLQGRKGFKDIRKVQHVQSPCQICLFEKGLLCRTSFIDIRKHAKQLGLTQRSTFNILVKSACMNSTTIQNKLQRYCTIEALKMYVNMRNYWGLAKQKHYCQICLLNKGLHLRIYTNCKQLRIS